MKGLSPQEIVEVAVRVEERGKAFYEAAALLAKDPKTKGALLFMAGQESIHVSVFRRILENADFRPYEESPEGEYAAFFRNAAKEYVFTADRIAEATKKGFLTLEDALTFALSIEEESVQAYRALRAGIKGSADELESVIKEEQKHCETVMALRDAARMRV